MDGATLLGKADSKRVAFYRSGRLPGGLTVGDQVVATTAFSNSTGSFAVGDVGTVKGLCSNASEDRVEEIVCVDFAGIKAINLLPGTYRRR